MTKQENKKKIWTFEEIEASVKKIGGYTSRTKLRMCKNEGCNNGRRPKSSFCQPCSTAYAQN